MFMPKPYDIVIFARDRWEGVWRRRHHLAVEFAAQGHRVVFVEPPRWPMSSDPGAPGMREVMPGVHVFAPLKFAPSRIEALRRASLASAGLQIAIALRALGVRRPVAWVTAEFAVHYLDIVAPRLSVYDVTDDWTAAPLSSIESRQIADDDTALLKRATLVSCVSESLAANKGRRRAGVRWLPNGVRVELYADPAPRPAELADIRVPIAGYVGTMHRDRFDVSLAADIARRDPSALALVIVGPNHLEPADTERLVAAGARLIPPQPPDRLPAFVHAFDVCVIPHLVSAFTDSLDPIKLYEYLAAGKPVVSTPVEGVNPYKQFVRTEWSPDVFHAACLDAARDGAPDANERRALARENSWAIRAREALAWIDDNL